MDLNSIKTVWLRVRWQTERLGPAGKLGFGLLVFSAVFFLVAVLPRQEESKVLMAKAEVLEARIRMEPSIESGRPRRRLQGDQALPAFYAFFPKLDSSPFWIGELVRIAGERGVEISGTEYRMVREKDLKLARYEMMVPVRGNYSFSGALLPAGASFRKLRASADSGSASGPASPSSPLTHWAARSVASSAPASHNLRAFSVGFNACLRPDRD